MEQAAKRKVKCVTADNESEVKKHIEKVRFAATDAQQLHSTNGHNHTDSRHRSSQNAAKGMKSFKESPVT